MASTSYPPEFKAESAARRISMLQKLIWLALAGAAGTLARYGLSTVVGRALGNLFLQNAVGIIALGMGLLLGRLFTGWLSA
jgi:fluoride ion exporter CrcB/FEX